jgi:hypothetical protein
VRVVVKAVEETQQRLVQHRVIADRAVVLLELRRARQLAVHQQVCDLEKARLRGELLDRVTTVQQDAGVAVDERDLALAGRREHEPGVEREGAVVPGQVRDVQAFGTERAAARLQDRLLAGRRVEQFVLVRCHRLATG